MKNSEILPLVFLLVIASLLLFRFISYCKLKNKLKIEIEKPDEIKVYKAVLKFHVNKGWYCEFFRNKVMCSGILNVSEEGFQKDKEVNVTIIGFSDQYILKLA